MNKQVRETWTALHGALVFDLMIEPGADPDCPSIARIYCRDKPAEHYLVEVTETRDSRFNLRFSTGCYVYGTLRRRARVNIDGVEHVGIFADIHFGFTGKYDEQHFEGFMVVVMLDPVPEPIPEPIIVPDNPFVPGPDLPIVTGPHDELFPYVYVRKWPTISTQDLQRCFIQYDETQYGSPPASSFYGDLSALRISGRAAMQDLALAFIEGKPPYQGQFTAALETCNPVAALLPQVRALAVHAADYDEAGLLAGRIEALYQVHDGQEMDALLHSQDYLDQLDLVWQSYFALIIILGYDRVQLARMIDTLMTAHLLFRLYDSPGAPSCAVLHDLLAASIILPPAVFPLPAAPWSPPCASPPMSAKGWIEPYAIGDLQMVRQRLLRYASGEIAHIENVMRGEKKEVGRRRVQRQIDYQRQENDQLEGLDNEASDGSNNLQEEARRAIAEQTVTHTYDDYKTTYGPPTEAKLNGSWAEATTQGVNPGSDDVVRFARDILNRSVSRIRNRINTVRASSTLNETEETVKSTIDNSQGERNLVCVFHWLNKVYEAHVVNYGNRLMLEFMLRNPAANFILKQQELLGENFTRPVNLQAQGITSFQSVDAGNYAMLAATYEVTDIEPPPTPLVYVTATLRSGQDRLVAIAPGYCAYAAFVNTVEAPGGIATPVVLVGREIFQAGDDPNKPRQFGEDTTMPVAVAGFANSFSPPSDTDALVNVIIACRPSATTMNAWRIKTYNAILGGYQKQMTRYDSLGGVRAGRNGPVRSPQASRQIEREELKQGCMTLLLERYAALTGGQDFVAEPGQPSVFSVNEPRYIQFFDDVFEWDEMSYRFQICTSGSGKSPRDGGRIVSGEDGPFTAFLDANIAKVMVPARPARVMAVLYFLSSGALWDGDNRLAPVSQDDIALVNDLKASGMQAAPNGHLVGQPWEIVIPTAMQVIDGAWGQPIRVEEQTS